jgi:uncharacterized membrane protein (UPF0136 family)
MTAYLFLILGVIFFILIKLNKALAIQGFTWGYFVKTNWVSVAMNLVAGIILIYSGYFQKKITDEAILNLTFASLGTTGAFVLQAIFDIFDKDKPTAIGVNKETEEKK